MINFTKQLNLSGSKRLNEVVETSLKPFDLPLITLILEEDILFVILLKLKSKHFEM